MFQDQLSSHRVENYDLAEPLPLGSEEKSTRFNSRLPQGQQIPNVPFHKGTRRGLKDDPHPAISLQGCDS